MVTTLVTRNESLEQVRYHAPSLFETLDGLKVNVKLDMGWDGSISHLKIMQLTPPALIFVPREFDHIDPIPAIAKYCGESNHIFFGKDIWIDITGRQRNTTALLSAVHRRFHQSVSGDVIITIRVPGEQDWRTIRITKQQWQKSVNDALTKKIPVEEAVKMRLTDATSTPSHGVIVAPLQPGTIIHGIGIYCGGPCKKIHPMDLPLSGNIRRVTDEKGWVELTGMGFVCPECLASARRDQSRRNEANRQAKK